MYSLVGIEGYTPTVSTVVAEGANPMAEAIGSMELGHHSIEQGLEDGDDGRKKMTLSR
jgi:hypothetical protein